MKDLTVSQAIIVAVLIIVALAATVFLVSTGSAPNTTYTAVLAALLAWLIPSPIGAISRGLRKQVAKVPLALLVFMTACGVSVAQIGQWVSSASAVFCPDLVVIENGGVVCSAVAAVVQAFVAIWASTHPTMAKALNSTKMRKLGQPTALVRVGSYGYFDQEVAAELMKPDCSAALDSYVKSSLGDGGSK